MTERVKRRGFPGLPCPECREDYGKGESVLDVNVGDGVIKCAECQESWSAEELATAFDEWARHYANLALWVQKLPVIEEGETE